MNNNSRSLRSRPLDRLGEMFELQGDLQRNTYGAHPSDIIDATELITFIKDMKLAADAELQEFLDETGWKPWATSRHVNEEAAQGELVDVFHFFMNLCMAVNMTPDMLFEKYKAKRTKNQKRQVEGYDGIAGKCPMCRKAYDDTAVNCHPEVAGLLSGYCAGPENKADPIWDYDEATLLAPEDI